MSNQKKDKYRLTELHKSDFELADGEPDIRGWKVKNIGGRIIGEVIELLFDPLSRSVKYLVMHIEGKSLNLISRNVLIPVGLADIHEELDEVTLPRVTVGHLASLPSYKRNTITPVIEKEIRSVFVREEEARETADTAYDRERFYQDDLYDEAHIYNRRSSRNLEGSEGKVVEEQVHTGGGNRFVPRNIVKNESRITNDPVPDNTRVSHLHPDDRNRHETGDNSRQGFAPFEEGTIEITEHREVPVVSKDARVVEEVSVHKDVSHRDETIRDTVRHTEVDVETFEPRDRTK